MTDLLSYYTQHSPMSDPKEHAALFAQLPSDLPGLHQIVQNVLLHVWKVFANHPDWLTGRTHEIESRTISDLITVIHQHDPQPLTVERPPEKKAIVDCRHFAGLLCTMMRQQGISARVRNGFATYLTETHYQDHWVCEYWNGERWILEDADLVSHDIPRDQFMVAGQVWELCRAGKTDANRYGYGPEADWRGLFAVRNNVIRDLAALNKVEEMSLADWSFILEPAEKHLSDEEMRALDQAAAASLGPDPRPVYASSPLRAPDTVELHNYTCETRRTVQILR